MKFIFDFDSVLFNTKKFIENNYRCLERAGIPEDIARNYYQEIRGEVFSMKNFISTLLERQKVDGKMEDIYEEMMQECPNLANFSLLKIVERLGKNNCFIVTKGDDDFQRDKIKRSNVASLFSEIYVVPESKKEIIENICKKYKNEPVIFVDDKIKFFDDLDMKACPNLKTILYDEQGLKKIISVL